MGYLGGYDKTKPLTVQHNHPVMGTCMVAASCSYSPTSLLIWGEAYEWSIEYVFGMAQQARL
jgi:hypothetical protein